MPASPTKMSSEFKLQMEGYLSDGSDKSQNSQDLKSSILSHNFDSQLQEGLFTDEDLNFQLYSTRVKMSMKRNILKRNMSEDLTWADYLKNEVYSNNLLSSNLNPFVNQHNRSLHSTPERKYDIPSEFDEKECSTGPGQKDNESNLSEVKESKGPKSS